jgi:hypothetical protein
MRDAMNDVVDSIVAKNQILLASIEREAQGIFARIERLARSAEEAIQLWQRVVGVRLDRSHHRAREGKHSIEGFKNRSAD